MVGKELAHVRVNIVGVNREAALGEKPRIDSRSRTEVEEPRAGRRKLQDQIPKGRRACDDPTPAR